MLNYAKIKDKSRIFRSFTGLTLLAFCHLLSAFDQAQQQAWQQQEAQRRTPRQRQGGGGRKPTLLTLEDQLVFILFYFKFYPTQEVMGFLFGMGQSQANEWIHRLTPLLNVALGYDQQLPARQAADLEQLLAQCPELEFIIDGTERPIQRPKDPQRQREHYSGKKKRPTVKNIVVSEKRTKKVKGLGRTQAGKKHDKAATDEEEYRFPKDSKLWKDLGFQGYEPEQTTTYQPKKKPRGSELTVAEKEQNQAISRERIGIEHSLAGVKVFRIVRDIYRNHKPKFEDLIMETACGLHNLRLDFPLTA
jgi:DDE superfamily endonuclease/Helix-turn-helix of DDE superfamily endonuclease